jgi:putative DNA primase/helicase
MNFEQALRQAGLNPREVVADGRIRRCTTESKPGKRNGWFVLHPDGHGTWGDWSSGTGEALGHWRDQASTQQAPSAQALAEQRARRERERQYRVQAMKSARAFWERARPLNRIHPYIERKALTTLGCAGLRHHDGLLVVPVMAGGWLVSLQTISATGEKRFWPGAPVKAGSFVMARPRAAVTVLVEGLATGLAVFQSIRTASVVVCFDAGNLVPVVQALKPHGSVVFMADNDHRTKVLRGFNPGIEKAQNAAELIGAGVAWVEGIEGTDAADAIKEWGEGAHKRLERLVLSRTKYVMGVA